MSTPDPRAFTFLDPAGHPLTADEPVDGPADEIADDDTAVVRRRARVDRWLPDGGGGAVAGLLLVLVAWTGATPLVNGIAVAFPQGTHRIGELSDDSLGVYGGGQYYGVTPGLIPALVFGTRALVVAIALGLGLRARGRERSPVATAATVSAVVSLVLFAAGAVLMAVGFALGHGGGYYSNLY